MSEVKQGKINIDLNVNESEQAGSRANASLHSGPETLAVSIDTCAQFPAHVATQKEAKAYLAKALAPLVAQGWQFDIAIGLDTDHEPD